MVGAAFFLRLQEGETLLALSEGRDRDQGRDAKNHEEHQEEPDEERLWLKLLRSDRIAPRTLKEEASLGPEHNLDKDADKEEKEDCVDRANVADDVLRLVA